MQMNGDARTQQINVPGGYPSMLDHPAITVNFGLSPRQLGWFLASIPTTIAALGLTGMFFMPAKEADMTALKGVVGVMQTDVHQLKASTDALNTTLVRIETAMGELVTAMDDRRGAYTQPPVAIPASPRKRVAPRPATATLRPSGNP